MSFICRGLHSILNFSPTMQIFHPHAQESFQKELWIYSLPEFQHPNILDFVSSRNDSLGMWIITTFHEHGSLSKILTRSDPLTWEQCISLVYSFASGRHQTCSGEKNFKFLSFSHPFPSPSPLLPLPSPLPLPFLPLLFPLPFPSSLSFPPPFPPPLPPPLL